MTRPQEVVTLKRDIASTVRRYGDQFRAEMFNGVSLIDPQASRSISDLTLDRIDYSDPIFVSEKVTTELQHRVKTSEPFQFGRVMPFTQRGFVWFERAINLGMSVVPGKEAMVHGISWGQGLVPTVKRGGTARTADGFRQLADGETGVSMEPGVGIVTWASTPEEMRHLGLAAIPAGYGLAAFGGWFRAEDVGELLSYGDDGLVMYDGARGDVATGSNIIALARTLWTMLDERVLVRAKVPLGRKDLRSAKRAGLDDRYVTTIHLRARDYVGERYEGGGSRDYAYQFPVREHVRTLHRGTPLEKNIVVRSYVKGPKDKPFRAPERLYSLDR